MKKGNFWIDYYAGGKRKREKIGTSKSLAIRVLRKRKVQIAENRYLDVKKEQKIKFPGNFMGMLENPSLQH